MSYEGYCHNIYIWHLIVGAICLLLIVSRPPEGKMASSFEYCFDIGVVYCLVLGLHQVSRFLCVVSTCYMSHRLILTQK